MINIFFSAAISALTILALLGCMRNITVVKSLDFIELDLSALSNSIEVSSIVSQLSAIPSFIKLGFLGYCTPAQCNGKTDNFAKFDIEKTLIDALVTTDSEFVSIAETLINLVLPQKFRNYISTLNKVIDGFSILLVVWIALSIVILVLKIIFFITVRGFFGSVIYNLVRGLASFVGVVCAALATAGLLYGRKEFNKDTNELGVNLKVGRMFLIFLWVAVVLGFIDQVYTLVTPSRLNRRVQRANPYVI